MQEEIKKLPPPESALALAKCNPRPEPTHILQRGNPHVPGDVVEPHFPAIFGEAAPEIPHGCRRMRIRRGGGVCWRIGLLRRGTCSRRG